MKRKENRKYKLKPQSLTDAEVQERLNLYSGQGDEKQFFSIQKIKQRYLEKNKATQDKRVKSDLFFAQGIRAGLPHSPHDTIKYTREEADQNYRNDILEEAKQEYRRHQNLSKWFNQDNLPTGTVPSVQGKNTPAKDQGSRKFCRKDLIRHFGNSNLQPSVPTKSKGLGREK